MKTNIKLFLPDYWDNLFARLRLSVGKDFDWELQSENLNVELTGGDGEAYEMILDSIDENTIPIMVLPITHCLLNIDAKKLKIIGPAFKTINDIYLVRNRKRDNINLEDIKIGVREKELTTSNISRIVFNHHFTDKFFYHDFDKEHRHNTFTSYISHIPISTPQDRLDNVLNSSHNAAIFMGKELYELNIFNNHDLIVAANMNRIICNLFNIAMFPRAVFAVFQEYTNEEHIKYYEEFFDLYNKLVSNIYKRRYNKYRSFHVNESQFFCFTGKRSEINEIRTIIRFTKELRHTNFGAKDSKTHWTGRDSPFDYNDFLWWKDINIENDLLKCIEEIDYKKIFSVNPNDKDRAILEREVNALKDYILDQIDTHHQNFNLEDILNKIDLLRINSKYKQELKEHLQNELK